MFDDDEDTGSDEGTPAGEPTTTVSTAPAPVPAAAQSILDSPEYKELAKQNRKLAREAGQAKASELEARAAAEAARLAAEATQQAAVEQQIADILGEEGVTEWNAIAELSSTDQVEAARRLAALMQRSQAQSPAPSAPAAAPAGSPPEGGTPVSGTPRVDADQPLTTQPGSEMTQLIDGLQKEYDDVVTRNQNPATRGRVTMKDRAAALIRYVGADYLRQGARPRSDR